MSKEKYPLEDLLKIKKRKFEKAVVVYEEKQEALVKEEEKLFKTEKQRDEVLKHKTVKLNQLREKLDEGANAEKVEMMKNYLKLVKEDLFAKEKAVVDQKNAVKKAEEDLETAKKDLFEKKKAVEKLKIHKERWKKTAILEEIKLDAIQEDEIGSVRHVMKKKGFHKES